MLVVATNPTLSTVCYALAYLTALAVFAWSAKRRGILSWNLIELACFGLGVGLAGAAIVQLAVTHSPGRSIIVGICIGYAAIHFSKAKFGITRPLGDHFALALAAGEGIGRLGCFFGGCCCGKNCQSVFSIYQNGAWRYPTQLYSSIGSLLIFAGLLWLQKNKKLPENGLFFIYGLTSSALRFGIENYRDVAPMSGVTITSIQLLCLAAVLYYCVMLWKQHKQLSHG